MSSHSYRHAHVRRAQGICSVDQCVEFMIFIEKMIQGFVKFSCLVYLTVRYLWKISDSTASSDFVVVRSTQTKFSQLSYHLFNTTQFKLCMGTSPLQNDVTIERFNFSHFGKRHNHNNWDNKTTETMHWRITYRTSSRFESTSSSADSVLATTVCTTVPTLHKL